MNRLLLPLPIVAALLSACSGAALLAAGRPAEAEAVYREDLKRKRENGWSLFGLAQSLRAQGKTAEADQAQAWARADVTLTASRF